MNLFGYNTGVVAWSIAIAVGFPLVIILLGIWRTALRQRNSPLASVARQVQNLLVPTIVIFLFLVYVAGAAPDATPSRLLLTIALLSGLYVLLAFVAEVVFGAAPEGTWRSNTPKLLRDIVIILIVAFGGALVAATVWDQDVAGLVTALGVGSIVLGLALQQTLGNVMSGIALLMEKPFTEGDFIEIDGVEGTVEQINWRATRITNRLGDLVILPHSITSGAKIINNTFKDSTDPVLVTLGFGYEHPPGDVKRMLMGVLEGMDGVVPDPAIRFHGRLRRFRRNVPCSVSRRSSAEQVQGSRRVHDARLVCFSTRWHQHSVPHSHGSSFRRGEAEPRQRSPNRPRSGGEPVRIRCHNRRTTGRMGQGRDTPTFR